MRFFIPAMISVAFLGTIGFPAESAQAETWNKVDCSGTHLGAPPGIQADCWQSAPDNGGTTSCEFFNYQIALPANANEPHFFAQMRESPNQKCGAKFPHGPEDTMQHETKFINEQAGNWSALQALDASTSIMFFDAKNQKQEGKCFAFAKLGPIRGMAGAGYTMFGYFCKRPGQPLDAAMAASLIQAIQIKS
jgi:hypothetical protein